MKSIPFGKNLEILIIPINLVTNDIKDKFQEDKNLTYALDERMEKNTVDNMLTGPFYKAVLPLEKNSIIIGMSPGTEMMIRFKKQFGSNGIKRLYGGHMLAALRNVTRWTDSLLQDNNRTGLEDASENMNTFLNVLLDGNHKRYYCVLKYVKLQMTVLRLIVDIYKSLETDGHHVAVVEAITWSTQAWLIRELYGEETGMNQLRGIALPFLSRVIEKLKETYTIDSLIVHEAMMMTQSFLNKGERRYGYKLDWYVPELPSAKIDFEKEKENQNFLNIWKTFNINTLIGIDCIHGSGIGMNNITILPCSFCGEQATLCESNGVRRPFCNVNCQLQYY